MRTPPSSPSPDAAETVAPAAETVPEPSPEAAPAAGVYPENERPSLTTRTQAGLSRFREGLKEGLPFPLWCQGALEALQMLILSLVVVAVPAVAAFLGGAWADAHWSQSGVVAGQWWLSAHGVPLIRQPGSVGAGGVLWFVPLALALVPLALAWRAGRRLARASWSDQLWQGIAGAAVVYAAGGALIALVARSPEAEATWWVAALVPLVIVLLGLVAGARQAAGGFGRLIGVDAAEWVRTTSQYSRWAGSYVWAVLRAGFIAWLSAWLIALIVLLCHLVSRWVEIVNVSLQLNPGALGGAVLAAGQAAYLPNLATWSLAWISGGGFAFGTEASFSPLEAHAGPMPTFPLLAALPSDMVGAWWVMALPIVAGLIAGWWFLREGENHLEESLQLRFGPRWLALTVSTLLLGLLVGAVAAGLSVIASLLSGGSWGIGVFTDIGPHVWLTALLLGLEVGVGTMLGYLIAPLFERDPVLDA